MTEAVFVRVIDSEPEQRADVLVEAASRVRAGIPQPLVFQRAPSDFEVIPGSPFAYWVSDEIRRVFLGTPPLESGTAAARVGLQTGDDYRFVRAWWEIDPSRIGFSAGDTEAGRGWVHFAKGGSYSPYFADIHLVVNWHELGDEIRNFERAYIRNESFYFQAGLTWSERTSWFSLTPLPSGCIFSVSGKGLFSGNLLYVQAIAGSSLANFLLRMYMARSGLDPKYQAGDVQRLPCPVPDDRVSSFERGARECVRLKRQLDSSDEVLHTFSLTPLLQDTGNTLAEPALLFGSKQLRSWARIRGLQLSLEDEVFSAYGLGTDERISVTEATENPVLRVATGPGDKSTAAGMAHGDVDEGSGLEDASEWAANLLMWCVGVAFGRWDVRMARDPSLLPELQGPFERLPRVAPGGLVDPEGQPATRDGIVSELWLRTRPNVITLPEPGSFEGPATIPASEYPIEVAWDGILVDDPDHPRDIVREVREVLEVIWGEEAEAIEEEALALLQGDGGTRPKTLRDWFRNQKASDLGKSFFEFHIQRYSKSRRKAPIYWRLCSNPGRRQAEYAVWLYWHRVTDDTLWTVVNGYVVPKRELEERRLAELRERVSGAEGRERSRLEELVEAKQALVEQLRWFERVVREQAEAGWVPEKDDGIVVNLASLRELVPWGEPEKVWKKLEKGDYDWAKTAMRHWPDRVRDKCQTDKSLAIAHGIAE